MENNYAFIDSQNLNLGIKKLGWKIDYRKLLSYLKEKYDADSMWWYLAEVLAQQKRSNNLRAVTSEILSIYENS